MLEARDRVGDRQALFLQAMPLIALESKWDVLNNSFSDVLRGQARWGKYEHYSLMTNVGPQPTIDGLIGRDSPSEPKWEIEVHRTGYVSLLFWDVIRENFNKQSVPVLHRTYCEMF